MSKRFLAAALLLTVSFAPAHAAKTSLVVGMPIEPPGLDPTIAAPVAIREVTLANLYEGARPQPGEVLVARMTNPDWVPNLRRSSALFPNEDDMTNDEAPPHPVKHRWLDPFVFVVAWSWLLAGGVGYEVVERLRHQIWRPRRRQRDGASFR